MNDYMNWIFEKESEHFRMEKIPSPMVRHASHRIQLAANIIGVEKAKELAKHKEYILSDELVNGMHSSGIDCPEEISCLSPKRWLKDFHLNAKTKDFSEYRKEWEGSGLKLVGVQLNQAEQIELKRFLALNNIHPLDVWNLLDYVDHLFFYKQSWISVFLSAESS